MAEPDVADVIARAQKRVGRVSASMAEEEQLDVALRTGWIT